MDERRVRLIARALGIVGAGVLALVVLAPGAVSTAGAAMQATLQRAGLVLVSNWPPPTPSVVSGWTGVEAAQPVASSGGAVRTGGQTLAEVQAQAAFPVCAPTWLPDGVGVVGGTASTGSDAIVVFGAADGRGPGSGGIQQMLGRREGGYVVPADQAKELRVHGRPAFYARGAWDGQQRWQAGYDAAILSWEVNGVTYVLQYSGLGLSEGELVRVAESCAPIGPAPTRR